MNHQFKTKRHQGDWGVLKAMQYFVSEGYDCFLPTTEGTRIDLIVTRDQETLRVQVKTSVHTLTGGRSFPVRTATSGGNRSWSKIMTTISADEVDLVFIWCAHEGLESCWLFPASEVEGKVSITVGHDNAEGHLVEGALVPPAKKGRPVGIKETAVREQSSRTPVEPPVCPVDGCETVVSRKGRSCQHHAAVESNSKRTRTEWVGDTELLALVREGGFSATARQFGVSDNAVRKRLRSRGLL